MSRGDPVELTRGLFAEATGPDVWLSRFAPDAMWEAESLGTTFRGVAAIHDFLDTWTGAFADFTMEAREISDLGGGVVFVVVDLRGHPRGAEATALQRRRPLVLIWADARIVKVIAPSSDIETARATAQREAQPPL